MDEKNALVIDITGNWRESEKYDPFVRVREPALSPGQVRTFHQALDRVRGPFTLELEYCEKHDSGPGIAIGNAFDDFRGLSVDGKPQRLAFQRASGATSGPYTACFRGEAGRSGVQLTLAVGDTRPLTTRLIAADLGAAGAGYYALPKEERYGGRLLFSSGVPFRVRELCRWRSFLEKNQDRGHLLPSRPGMTYPDRIPAGRDGRLWRDPLRFTAYGVPVNTIHFLGMIHNIDIANGSWYAPKGDHGYSHFVGDKAGEIILEFSDGGSASVPLVFGFNLWYGLPWDNAWRLQPFVTQPGGENLDALMFGGAHDEYRETIRKAIRLRDGVRYMGAESGNARYVFSIRLDGRSLESVEVRGVPTLYDFPLISAITLETARPMAELDRLPAITREIVSGHEVDLETARGGETSPEVEKIQRIFFTFVEDLPDLKKPEKPEGYFGPQFDFRGSPEAVYAATYLYRNAPECASYIADSGMGCGSQTAEGFTVHYTLGTGLWFKKPVFFGSIENWLRLYRERSPGNMPGLGNAWTRGVGELLREAMAFGYDKFADSYLDWLDNCLFTEASPPHWNRVAGSKSFYDNVVKVGDVEERGNRENDGHGICMWGRYMTWHWKGRPREWNERRWCATEAAVEWVQWQLDHDTLYPGARKDVLFTDSECAHGDYDIYSTYNCLHGVKLSIRMAEQLGKTETAEKWRRLHRRLQKGILAHLVRRTDAGPIWHTEEMCDWQDHAHMLAHLHLAADGDTYTPLQDDERDELERACLEVSRNSYRYLMRDKNYDCLRMYGYGQGMMAQAALLLDEMEDAAKFLELMVSRCWQPHLGGWAAPEGIMLHPSGKYYLPVNGYSGQDSHLADSVKALRVALGFDDNDPTHLRLVPRLPAAWTHVGIEHFPVLTGESRQLCAYTYTREAPKQEFEFRFERPVGQLSVRLGPIPAGKELAAVSFNGREHPARRFSSGDSRWVWLENLSGSQGRIGLRLA